MFWTVLECIIFEMESSKSINYVADMCSSCPSYMKESGFLMNLSHGWSQILRVPGTQLQRVNCHLERRRAQVSCVKWRLEGTKIRIKYTIDGYQIGQNNI